MMRLILALMLVLLFAPLKVGADCCQGEIAPGAPVCGPANPSCEKIVKDKSCNGRTGKCELPDKSKKGKEG